MPAGRDPIDRVVDAVVGLPVSVYVAARRAAPLPWRAVKGRLLRPIDDDAPPDEAAEPAAAASASDTSDEAVAEAASPVSLPLEDYDHLAARQVVDRLDSLLPDELAAIAEYERAHRHRQTILRKIDQLA